MNRTNYLYSIDHLLAGALLILGISCSQPSGETTINPSGFKISKGVNLSHWLSQDFGWEPKYTYIKESDLRFIESIGYDHVRIPIDEIEMWDEKGNPVSEAFDRLSQCLEWCAKYDLRAIVDLHVIRAHHFNASNDGTVNTLWTDSAAQENLINLWLKLSAFLHSYPNHMVAYELLNEPVAPMNEDWSILMNKILSAIRKPEPDRVVIVGGNMWQIPKNLPDLKIPENDRNIILSFHTYSPMALTHYKADWTPIKDYQGPVHYPGQIITNAEYDKYVDTTNLKLVANLEDARDTFNIRRLSEVFKPALEFAKEKQLQLYCGEFGCMPTIKREDRLKYYSDMVASFSENEIAWCNWEYKGDFGIYFFDQEKKISTKPDKELINILLKR